MPDYASLAQSQLKRLQRGHATIALSVCECRHRDGSFRTLSWTAVPGDGLVHAVAKDVTAENAATAELELAQEALRQSQKMEAVGQLTGGIAHDFNNLLTGIIGALQLMQKRAERGHAGGYHPLYRYGDGIGQARRRAHPSPAGVSRRQPLAPKPTQPTQLIRSLTELFERTLGERIALDVDLQDDLWNVLCDPHQLENAILNLVINARDAMPDGGTLTITARNVDLDNIAVARRRYPDRGRIRLPVRGRYGRGHAAGRRGQGVRALLQHQAAGRGHRPGLVHGLRLRPSIGRVYGTGQPAGRGHVDPSVSAAVYRAGGGSAGGRRGAGSPAAPAPTQQPLVLVVEDDPRVRDLLVEVLQDLGCRVVEAADGLSGLRILKDTPSIQLVISDIGLPGMDGRRMVEEARVHHPDLKVILVTGYAQSLALTEGLRDPGMELVTKPFGIDEITRRITGVLAS